MIILSIETSCDDTCIAILEIKNSKFKLLSNVVSSQEKLHAKYGGVWPFLAKREHKKNLPIVFKKALKEAKIAKEKINLIAVTTGPGLEPCLWQGVNFTKDLAEKLKIPIIPIDHIEAHILSNFLPKINSNFQIFASQKIKTKEKENKFLNNFSTSYFQKFFPAICLIVSGGHTQLILIKKIGNYKILGETRDDAAGECFDKIARILGLGYPGGPAIAAEAAKYKIKNINQKIQLPRPMINQKNYDFSFSGLKTSVLYLVKNLTSNNKKLTIEQKRIIAFEAQQAIIDVLIHKTLKAVKEYKVKTVILGGGVTANKELKKQFKEKIQKEFSNLLFLTPHSEFCTDNAAMIAITGYFNWLKNKNKKRDIEINANLRLE